LDHIKQLVK